MVDRNNVKREVERLNPWYVSEQLLSLNNPHQIRTIKKRWEFIDKVINKVRDAEPDRTLKILDAGCGDGLNLKILSNAPNAQVLAYEYNPIRVERVKKNFSKVKVIEQDLTNIKMDEGDFDLILSSQVLEHIHNDLEVLKELKNILSLNGVLILGVPNEGCFLARLRNHVLEPYIAKTTDHVHFYTKSELLKIFTAAELCVVDKLCESFFFPMQRIANFFVSRDWGFKFMDFLQRLFPSQAAGFYFVLKHSDMRSKTNS